MIKRITNTFIPFTSVLVLLIILIIILDNYAHNLSIEPEIIEVSENSELENQGLWDFESDYDENSSEKIYRNDQEYKDYLIFNKAKKFNEAEKMLSIINSKHPLSADVLFLHGTFYQNQKKYTKALKYYRDVLDIDNKHLSSIINLGICVTKLSMYREAEAYYKKAIEIRPNHFSANLNLLILYTKKEEWNKAVEQADKTLPLSSGVKKAKVFYYKGYAHSGIKDTIMAIKAFEESILLKPDYLLPRMQLAVLSNTFNEKVDYLTEVLKLHPSYTPAYLLLAKVYTEADKLAEAEYNLQLALSIDPGSNDITHFLGDVYLKGNKTDFAESLFVELQKNDSLLPQNYFFLAKVYSTNGNNSRSVSFYKKAIKMASGYYPEAFLNMGLLYKRMNLIDSAEIMYNKAIELEKDYHQAYYNLAILYQETNNISKAKKNYLKTLNLNENYEKAWFNLAVLYDNEEKKDSAVHFYKQAVRVNPAYLKALMNLAILYRKSKQYDQSLVTYNLLLQKYPGYVSAWYNKAIAQEKSGDTTQAIKTLQQVLKLEPQNIKGITQLAKLYNAINQNEKAEFLLNEAIDINPSDHELRFELAKTYYIINNKTDAVFQLNKIIKLKPKYGKAYKLLSSIYENEKNYKMAAVIGEKQYSKNNNAETAYRIARIYDKDKNHTNAEKWYLKAISKGIEKSWAYYWLGKLYFEQSKYGKADEYLKLTLQKDKNHKYAYLFLAKTYANTDRIQAAKNYINKALTIDPKFEAAIIEQKKINKYN